MSESTSSLLKIINTNIVLNYLIVVFFLFSLSFQVEIESSNLISIKADSFLEISENASPNYTEFVCTPKCEFGLCYQAECKCQEGFTGVSCSEKIKADGFRVSMLILILLFVGAAIVGGLMAFILFKLFSCCCSCNSNKYSDLKENVDFAETWEKRST